MTKVVSGYMAHLFLLLAFFIDNFFLLKCICFMYVKKLKFLCFGIYIKKRVRVFNDAYT